VVFGLTGFGAAAGAETRIGASSWAVGIVYAGNGDAFGSGFGAGAFAGVRFVTTGCLGFAMILSCAADYSSELARFHVERDQDIDWNTEYCGL
jgi:hypothetical protein